MERLDRVLDLGQRAQPIDEQGGECDDECCRSYRPNSRLPDCRHGESSDGRRHRGRQDPTIPWVWTTRYSSRYRGGRRLVPVPTLRYMASGSS
jgi:hypothetical protein